MHLCNLKRWKKKNVLKCFKDFNDQMRTKIEKKLTRKIKFLVNGDCIICDSNNESEEDCGFVKDSLNPLVTTCTSNCFTRIYESKEQKKKKLSSVETFDVFSLESDIAKPGWYTQRGCLGESDTCPEETCTSCEENNCNKELYPADRNKCLKCEGEACNAPKSEYCQVYLPDSRDCLTFFDQGL